MGHREEMAKILDIVRSDRRKLYEKDPMSKLSVDELIVAIRKEGLFITNVYEGTDNMWRCHLRYKKNQLLGESGHGQTMAEAIWYAFDLCRKGKFENRDKPAKTMSEKIEAAPKGLDFSKLGPVPGLKPKPKPPVEDDDLLGGDEEEDLLG